MSKTLINSREISKIFKILQLSISKPEIELNYHNPFSLLVAVILSAQSTDIMVNKITDKLFNIAKTPEEFLKLGEEGLKQYIKSINYFNVKAKHITQCAALLLNRDMPDTLEELVKLPGIGRKSANVILNVIFHKHTVAVDTHVFRVSNRIGLCSTQNPFQTEIILEKIIPKRFLKIAHHLLVLHGRYTCKARKPLCLECKINKLCKKLL
ncbi:Endonuclease III [Candidatus Fokinia solitaria]|uniref:Endonuclease III n=1 Tax=Candidatus Fokinia solitaria TaxID=1802984 RepID=A0A2U8BS73_9RICK|nr:endonuclease III [Candidatus Fokinia solitaria]AWD33204.1 Endonuclease III [Candidatus Fokinia solitaria]